MKMRKERITIENIPALVWGREADKVLLCVHGKMGSKDVFAQIAEIAEQKGYQTLSFDLPQHGERQEEAARCDVWNGIRDLNAMGDYAFRRWKHVSLYACSLGAYFSLQAYPEREFEQCLFQSPIVDMEYLVGQMMTWFDVTEERLEVEGEIDTPIDPLRWDYWQYIRNHPVNTWHVPTHILFAGKDNMQTLHIMNDFAERFGVTVQVAQESEHPFMGEGDGEIVNRWLQNCLA